MTLLLGFMFLSLATGIALGEKGPKESVVIFMAAVAVAAAYFAFPGLM